MCWSYIIYWYQMILSRYRTSLYSVGTRIIIVSIGDSSTYPYPQCFLSKSLCTSTILSLSHFPFHLLFFFRVPCHVCAIINERGDQSVGEKKGCAESPMDQSEQLSLSQPAGSFASLGKTRDKLTETRNS